MFSYGVDKHDMRSRYCMNLIVELAANSNSEFVWGNRKVCGVNRLPPTPANSRTPQSVMA